MQTWQRSTTRLHLVEVVESVEARVDVDLRQQNVEVHAHLVVVHDLPVKAQKINFLLKERELVAEERKVRLTLSWRRGSAGCRVRACT